MIRRNPCGQHKRSLGHHMRKHRALGTKMVLAGFDAGKSDHRPVSGPSGGEKGEDLESEVAAAVVLLQASL